MGGWGGGAKRAPLLVLYIYTFRSYIVVVTNTVIDLIGQREVSTSHRYL